MKTDAQLFCTAEKYNPYLFVEGAEVNAKGLRAIVGGLPKDTAQANELKTFKVGEEIGFFTGERQLLKGTVFYKTKYLHLGSVREPTGFNGWGAGKYTDQEVFLWVSAENVTDDMEAYWEQYNAIPNNNKPPVVTDPTKPSVVTDPTKTPVVDKSIFKQTDPTTGEQKPNYLLYGGIALGALLIGVGLYWAFGSKPEPQPTPTIQYVPQPQPMK
jgi:hypothetical protein